MRQIIQNLKSGDTTMETLPRPRIGSGEVLIQTHRSLVSLGTERMLVSFGQANLIDKARQQPERVQDVINRMKTDGIKPTVETVFRKLDTPIPLGYSNAGEVIAVGENVSEFRIGDRVVSNGAHAELVSVPKNLVAKIPDGVSYEQASFAVVSAIALQGIRLIEPTFGETVVVMGLGLIGLIAAQLLKANGCEVIGIDIDNKKLKIARDVGITAVNSEDQDPVQYITTASSQRGADAVLISATTKSNKVLKQSAEMSRKKGRIVLVGVVGLDLDRSDFYEKELSFQVSCSYGPGRYDNTYEEMGQDYPLPYVRWTEKRNFEAVLQAMDNSTLKVEPLISEKVKFDEYPRIYDNISDSDAIAYILEYSTSGKGKNLLQQSSVRVNAGASVSENNGSVAIIGAGNFTQAMILPSLNKTDAHLKYIVSSSGLSSTQLAKKYNIEKSSTDFKEVLRDETVTGILITTRHNLHASMTVDALMAGKTVFVEKPLALNMDELNDIIEAQEASGKHVIVGFNRRFSPHIQKIKALIGSKPEPMSVIATMNAGHIPPESWVHDLKVGGGRIIGEACHYIDLINYLTGSIIESVYMQALGKSPKQSSDTASIILKYANGSIGQVNYFANGNKSYSKERIEIFYQGKNLVLDNFRKLYGYGFNKSFLSNRILKTKLDKGHQEQFNRLTRSWREGGDPIIPFFEIVNASKATFAALESLEKREEVKV